MSQSDGYPPEWPGVAKATKDAANWCCVRCGHAHDPASGHTLTVHHLNGVKRDLEWFNCVALCQRCHLTIQGRVDVERPWVFEHSEWFQPYVAGHYARKYLGEILTRDQVMGRLDELLSLEAQAVIGRGPIGLGKAG